MEPYMFIQPIHPLSGNKSTYSLNTQNRNSKYIPKNSKAIQSFHFAVLHQCCTLQHFYFLYNKILHIYVSQRTHIHTCIDVLNKYPTSTKIAKMSTKKTFIIQESETQILYAFLTNKQRESSPIANSYTLKLVSDLLKQST